MASDFNQFSYTSSGFQSAGPIIATLVAGAAMADIATFDLTSLRQSATISIDVSTAALNGLEIWVRGDPNARWIPLTLAQVEAYGRNDAGTDVTTTPAGATGFIKIADWATVLLRAKSAGAAVLTITAGGK